MTPANGAEIINLTVAFTLAVGIGFIIVGIRGRQNWLKFWGGLTCCCYIAYFFRGYLGIPVLG